MKKDKFGFKGGSIILWNRKISILWVILAVFFFYFLYVSVEKTIENSNLNKKGIETTAVVRDVRKVGSKGVIRCTYTFEVKSLKYSGSVDDDYYKIGDSIRIIYLEKNPEINRDKKFLEK